MRKKIVSSLLLCMMVIGMQAQDISTEDKNEISIAVGSLFNISDIDGDAYNYDRYSPSVSLGYNRHLNRIWAIGMTLTYTQEKKKYTFAPDSTNPQYDNYNYICMLLGAKATWSHGKKVNWYSRLGVGPALVIHDCNFDKTKLETAVPFQLTPIAIEFGNDKLRGFAELGYGIQGIINVGISHRF